MFQLGTITGLFSSQIETVKQTGTSIGSVIDDMAKTASDIPQSMLAPAKSVAVAGGCFSEAVVTKVTTEDDLEASQQAAEAEAAAAAMAESSDSSEAAASAEASAVATESADGGKTPEVSTKSVSMNVFNTSTTLGGRMNKSRDPRSGSNLAHMPTSRNPANTVRSAIQEAKREQARQERQFKRDFCNQAPYPECAMCPYATRTMYVTSDLDKLLSQLEQIIGLLVKGLYSLSAGMFKCPGQLRGMLLGDFSPFAGVVIASAMSALATLVAVRGALEHFEGLVASIRYTDFRGELTRMVKDLFKSGALIGMPKAFTKEIGRLLKDIGFSANNIAKMVSGKTPSRGTRYGRTFSVYGDHSYNSKLIDGYYRTAARRAASVKSVDKAAETLKKLNSSMYKAAAMANDPTVQLQLQNDPKQAAALARVKADTESTQAAAPEKSSSSSSGKTYTAYMPAAASSSVKTYTVSTDTTAQSGVTYKVLDTNGEYVNLEDVLAAGGGGSGTGSSTVTPGMDLDAIRAIYGDIFVVEDNGVTRPDPVPCTDTIAVTGRVYYIKDPITGRYIQIPDTIFTVGTSIDFSGFAKFDDITPVTLREALRDLASRLCIPVEDFLTLLKNLYVADAPTVSGGTNEVTETEPIIGVDYYIVDTTVGSPTIGQFIPLIIDPADPKFPEGVTVYTKSVPLEGEEKGATSFSGSSACVLDNGLVIAEPVFLDAESYRMSIDTRALVTVTGVLAGDMATIEDIGLSAYEIKIAYLLDHERNGSIMPDDVYVWRIPTILDELIDE